MLKSITDLLHRTPWWGLISFFVITFVAMVLLAIPYNVIHFHSIGETRAEERMIRREIDAAFATSGLSLAEKAVRTVQRFSRDPIRQAELDGALEEIARARREVEAQRTGERRFDHDIARDLASGEAELDRQEGEIDKAMAKFEQAVDARETLEESLEELNDALRRSDVPGTEWPKSIDEKLAAARATESAAKSHLDRTRARMQELLAGADLIPPAPPVPPLLPPTGGFGADKSEALEIDSVLREEIRAKVASDFFRLAFASILIFLFVPTFLVLAIAKFFVDRARSSQIIAEEKSYEADRSNLERQLVEARLQALQAQVEPHFLYNTLANVQALIEIDPPSAGTMVGHLIDYLRAALPKMRESASTIAQELELARAYLSILKMRMGQRLEFAIDASPEALACEFPPLMLPSLVENAVKHGLEPMAAGGRIDIQAQIENDQLVIKVTDTGRGLHAEKEAGTGIGLANIRERLAGIFGDQAALTLQDVEPQGVTAIISVPRNGSAHRTVSAASPAVSAGKVAVALNNQTADASPQSVGARASRGLAAAHRIWTKVIAATFVALAGALLVGFVAAFIAVLIGEAPIQIGSLELHGLEAIALSVGGLFAGFGVSLLAVGIVSAVLYGVGLLFAGLMLLIPVIIIFALAPPLAPFMLVGLLIYWIVKKRQPAKQ